MPSDANDTIRVSALADSVAPHAHLAAVFAGVTESGERGGVVPAASALRD